MNDQNWTKDKRFSERTYQSTAVALRAYMKVVRPLLWRFVTKESTAVIKRLQHFFYKKVGVFSNQLKFFRAAGVFSSFSTNTVKLIQ